MARSPHRRFRTVLLFLVAGAAGIRVLHLVEQVRNLPFIFHPVLDARLYHQWAVSLARGDVLPGAPYYHAPGYPQILALVYTVFGASPVAAVVLQSLLGVATTTLVVLLAARLFGTAEALLAGLLFLAYGPVVYFETKLLAATVSVFLSALVVVLAVQVERARPPGRMRRWGTPVLLGLAAGLLAVVRGNLILVPLFLVAVYAVKAWRGTLSRQVPLLVTGALLFVLLPSFLHNLAHGAAVPVATNGGFNFYSGNRGDARAIYLDMAGVSGVIRTQEAEADSLVRSDLGHALSPGAESRYWVRRGLEEIAADPRRWLGLVAAKARLLVNRVHVTVNGSYPLEADHVLVYRLAALPFNLLVFLGLGGLVLAGGRGRRAPTAAVPLAGPVAVLAAVLVSSLFFFVMERLRLPAVPILAVFAGYALVAGFRSWRAGTRAPVVGAVVVTAVLTGLTWSSPLGAARDRSWEAGVLVQVGNAAVQAGETDRALGAYRLAEETDSTALEPLQAQSQIYMERGNADRAVRALERAAGVAPGDSAVHSNLGIAYLATGNLNGCLREMEAASGLAPRWGVPLFYEGIALRLAGDPGAASRFIAAIDRDPGMEDAYNALIDLLVQTGRPEEARHWLKRALANGVAVPPALRSRVR